MTLQTVIVDGLEFPEGPIAMPDGQSCWSRCAANASRVSIPTARRPRWPRLPGGPNGAAVGPDGAIYLCNNGGCVHLGRASAGWCSRAVRPEWLHRWADPARRSQDRRRDRPLHRVRRSPVAGTERPRDGRPRRLVVHRPRHPRPCRPHERPHRHLLRQGRRVGDPRGRVPGRVSERHRPVARRCHALLRRDAHRSRVPPQSSSMPGVLARTRAARSEPCAVRAARHAAASTRWRSTATATCVWRRCSTAASR